jgi:hypothetical protein
MKLSTTREVINTLGGYQPVADLCQVSLDVAWKWAAASHFPPKTYVALKSALRERGSDAPDTLWRMVQPRSVESEG